MLFYQLVLRRGNTAVSLMDWDIIQQGDVVSDQVGMLQLGQY